MTMKLSDGGLAFIASLEGFRPQLYNDPAGHATIGYGHLVHKGKIDGSEPGEFKRGISNARALELLRADVATAERAVRAKVKVDLTQDQFDALVSFTFNVGAGALGKSDLLARLNAGAYHAVPGELARWNRGGGRVLPGLVARRAAEGRMWARSVVAQEVGGGGAGDGVAAPLPHIEELQADAKDARWHAEEATRELEAGEVEAARARLREHVTPRLLKLEAGIL